RRGRRLFDRRRALDRGLGFADRGRARLRDAAVALAADAALDRLHRVGATPASSAAATAATPAAGAVFAFGGRRVGSTALARGDDLDVVDDARDEGLTRRRRPRRRAVRFVVGLVGFGAD